ncbi:MAG: DUF3473 domain-containing protein [Verrucomicrobia bacterium]|jgi:polysaccharide deacetylase family protein (PEP-CTERM system associated)|nr:DUF3473 domain-containing protein [Verrucomicrobiota bacterium]MBT7701376.1 DUF3473 domain-containing protein [Verrucomicrobiota bacterium]
MPLVLTIDVEDWAQSTLDTELPITDRAGRNMEHLLDVLAAANAKVTCFVLGKFAEKFPSCVKRIAAEGHEVASHGYGHVDVFRLSPQTFREDVRRSKAQLEALTGLPVKGYRAPCFSITRSSLWALLILAEEGFQYDSSIYPVANPHYGIPDWPTQPVRAVFPSGMSLVELPLATASLLGRHWPVAGGGYHRLLPWPCIHWAIAKTMARDETFVSYCHPYEFDPAEFAHLPFRLPVKTRLHQGLGRRGFEGKFAKILAGFESRLAVNYADERAWPDHALSD